MSEPENFVTRWSRRKREAAQEPEAATSGPAPGTGVESERATQPVQKSDSACVAPNGAAGLPELPFDLASLPPIESITGASDIRAFLAPGVPSELTRAALRRVWTADPAIRDFVGLAENAWDFNAPGAIAGFGSLEMTDELRREVMRMVGKGLTSDGTIAPEAIPRPVEEAPATVETAATGGGACRSEAREEQRSSTGQSARSEDEQHSQVGIPRCDNEYVATQYAPVKPDNVPATARRLRGRALPE